MDEALAAVVAAHKGASEVEAEPATATETTTAEQPAEAETEVEASEEEVAQETAEETAEEPQQPASKAISEWAALELKNRRESQRLEAERKELETAKSEAMQASELLGLLKTNPREFFSKAGVPIDELTKQILEDKKIDPNATRIEQLEQQLEAIRNERKQETETQQQARLQRAQEEHHAHLRAWFEPQAETYPYLMAASLESEGDPTPEQTAQANAMVADAIAQMQEKHFTKTQSETGKGEFLDPSVVAGKLDALWKARIQRAAAKLPGSGSSDAAPAPEKTGTSPTTIGRRHASRTNPAKKAPKQITGRDRALARLRGEK